MALPNEYLYISLTPFSFSVDSTLNTPIACLPVALI
jgi:hypothetical protein